MLATYATKGVAVVAFLWFGQMLVMTAEFTLFPSNDFARLVSQLAVLTSSFGPRTALR